MKKQEFKVTADLAIRVRDTVKAGLSCGLGVPKPGHMCVESAVCYAMGMPHGDQPTCVLKEVRRCKIWLNDLSWSSKKARAKGLIQVAIAQLGSNQLNRTSFTKQFALEIIRGFPEILDDKDLSKFIKITELSPEKMLVILRAKFLYIKKLNNDTVSFKLKCLINALKGNYNYLLRLLGRIKVNQYSKSIGSTGKSKGKDKVLSRIADCMLRALIKLKSPGCSYLHLLIEHQ